MWKNTVFKWAAAVITWLLSVCISGFCGHIYFILVFKFSFSFSPFLSCCGTLKGIWGLWTSEVHHSAIKPSAPHGTTAAQAWCAQTAEAAGFGAGRKLNSLGVSESGWVPLLRARLVRLLAWIKLSLRGETQLPSLHGHAPAVVLVRVRAWVRREEARLAWPCEMLQLWGCLRSRTSFCSYLTVVPNCAPAQEQASGWGSWACSAWRREGWEGTL